MKNTKLYIHITQSYDAETLMDICEYGCLSCEENELNNKKSLNFLAAHFENDICNIFKVIAEDDIQLKHLLNKKMDWVQAVYVLNYIAEEYVSSSY